MTRIGVALVNDYEIVVQGLARMLHVYESTICVVELDARTSVSAPVDIALYDTFARADGGDGVRELVANPRVRRVAVYSWNTDPVVVASMLDSGADAYLSKALPASQLVDALVAVHEGRRPDASPPRRLRTAVEGNWPGRDRGLTQRESEVLALITQGLSNDAIARAMHLSTNSVKTHIRTCYRRLGLTSRPAAILWGIDHGFRPDHVRIAED